MEKSAVTLRMPVKTFTDSGLLADLGRKRRILL
jgi:hypothetical protein